MNDHKHAPFYYLALDVLQGVLARAHSLVEAAEYVVVTMRELTGARMVVLVAGHPGNPSKQRILSLSPERKRALVTATLCADLWQSWREQGRPALLTPTSLPQPSRLSDLAPNGLMVLPLSARAGENGALFFFDLPERHEHLADVFAFLQPLQTLLGLVLSQSLLVEEQEGIIAERTTALARSEAFYRTLFDTSPIAIAVTDAHTGRFQDLNAAFVQLTGRSRESLIGSHHGLLAPEASQTNAAHAALADDGHDPARPLDSVVVRSDGSQREVEIRARLLPGIAPASVLAFFDDVTERNRLRNEERRLQEQLHQAQKMEALGALAGGIAHDFNNLLSSIRGFTELTLLDLEGPSPAREQLEFALRAADRAKELVQQILTFSHRSRSHTNISVSATIQEAMQLLRSSLPDNITCQLDIAPNAGAVQAHPAHLHQIVMNLCTNAAHAMSPTGGILSVRVHPRAVAQNKSVRDGDYVEISIADTGAGINEVTLGRIFEPYFTTKPMGQGTGLGLSIVHGIVKSMGGHIQVASQVGKGTLFTLLLPKSPDKAVPHVDPSARSTIASVRVLWVDDDAAITLLGSKMLESLGHQVTCVNSSLDALALFERDPDAHDLVVTDQIMPTMSGSELVSRMWGLRPGLPVVLCSGYTVPLDGSEIPDTAISVYLTKPFSRQQLVDAVERALKERAASR